MNPTVIRVSLAVLLAPAAYAVVLLLAMLFGWAVAHAGTGASAVPELGLETKLAAWAVAVYAIARTVLELLKVIAPRTPTKVDDEVRDALARILADARPPTVTPPPTSSSTVEE